MSAPVQQHPDRPRVVIVDADRRVQQSLRGVLRVAGEVEVVGTAGDVRGALELIEQQRPDVVIVDPRLPDVDAGAALVRSIRLAWPSIRVVATGWAFDMPDVNGHAMSFVAKSAQPEEFVSAVVTACSETPAPVIPEVAPSGP
jgi:DNA-binding NarL/FixJ family response regulator